MRSTTTRLFLAGIVLLSACGDDGGSVTPMDGGGADALADGGMPPADGPAGDVSPDGGAGPRITLCPGDALPPPATGVCEVTAGDENLLFTGDVLTPGEVLRGGQVLVSAAGTIACVSCDCSGAAAAAGAATIVCPDGVLSPGLINPHDHITFDRSPPYVADPSYEPPERYEHREDWRDPRRGHTHISARDGNGADTTANVRWSELRHVMAGTTSTVGAGGEAGLLRNLDRQTLLEAGLGGQAANNTSYPVYDFDSHIQIEIAAGCDGYAPRPDDAAEATSQPAYVPHIAEGIDGVTRNEFLCSREGEFDLIQPQTAVVHGVGLLPQDIAEMAGDGASLIWSPRSNISLYGDTARVTEYVRLGVPISLGTDWVRSGSMNLLRELACADSFNQNHLAGFFTDEDLWRMVTFEAAAALARESEIGLLAVGYQADIAIFDGAAGADHRAVLNGSPDAVSLVLRGGQVLYGDSALVGALEGGCDVMDVCGVEKRACLSREIGTDLATLTADNTVAYPLFFCGEPADEPSCVPGRNAMDSAVPSPEVNGSNRYTGVLTSADGDGDGIEDGADNCPAIFNPIRPLDDGVQADFDGDGAGDACDPCPLAADTTDCPTTLGDRDGDGVMDTEDNCGDVQNPEQADADGDGKGDACDLCPDDPNPGGQACPATIYDIKNGTVPVGSVVSVSGVLVTGVGYNGFFVQVDPASADYAGAPWSGVFVYVGGAPSVAQGDRVDITSASVTEFSGQTELERATVSVLASGVALPLPVDVTPADVTTGGPMAAALEAVLVRVRNVVVTDPNVAGTTGEMELDSILRVDDFIYRIEPTPVLGQEFASLTGVVALRSNIMKLLPRSNADVGRPMRAPRLLAIEPETLSVALDRSVTLTVVLDTFAPVGGTTVSLFVDMGGSVPADVTVPAGALTGDFLFTSGSTETTATVTAMLGLEMATATLTLVDAAATGLVINEVDYDQTSTDTMEFVEVYNGTASPISLSSVALVFVNQSGTEYDRVPLSDAGASLAPDGYLVFGSATLIATVPGTALTITASAPDNLIQNGPGDGIVLFDTTSMMVIDSIAYEGTLSATVDGVAVTFTPADAQDGTTSSIGRIPNGLDTDAPADWQITSAASPGATN